MKHFAVVLFVAGALVGCASINPFASSSKQKLVPLVKLPAGAEYKPVWKSSVGSSGPYAFSPAVSGDAVFAASADGKVQRLEKGASVWKISLSDGLSGGVGVGADIVVVGTPKGDVIALDAKTGKESWRAKVGAEILAAPVIAEGLVIARSGDSRLIAFGAVDGKRRWMYQRSAPALTLRSNVGLIVRGGRTFAGFPGGKLVAIMNTNGVALWEATVALPKGATELERITDITSEPVISGGLICAVAFQGKLACFDVATGNGVWSRDISSSVGVDIEGNSVYVTDDKGIIYALALTTGATIWKQEKLVERGIGRPIAMNKHVMVADAKGLIHYLDVADGAIVGRSESDSSGVRAAPVRDGQGILVQTVDGAAYRFDGVAAQ